MFEPKNVQDLIDHYAKIKAKLWGPVPVQKVIKRPVVVKEIEPPPAPPEKPVGERKPEKNVYVLTKALLQPKPAPVTVNVVALPQPTEPILVPEPRFTFQEIVKVVLQITHLTKGQLFARRRLKNITDSRHLLWALSRNLLLHMSLPQIAQASGSWDHTTVLHGARRGLEHPDYARAHAYLMDVLEHRKRAANATLDNQRMKEIA